jgi:nitroreductase
MDTIKAIQSRTSVRKYKDKKPDWRDILEAINSARFAPMAGGTFTLKFIVIDKEETIEEIAKYSEQEFIKDAKYLVAFVSNPKKTEILYKKRGERYLRQQAGATIQNFMLHLTNVGLSTCWIGHFNDEKIKKILKIPDSREVEAIITVGYGKTKSKKTKEKGATDKILYFNEWDNKQMREIKKVEGRGPGWY